MARKDLWAIPDLSEARRLGIYVGACVGLIVFSAVLVWTATGQAFELPWYEPLERRWIVAYRPPTNVAMDFYTRFAMAMFAACLAGPIAAFIAGRKVPRPVVTRALGVWAVGITLLGMFLYAWALGTRVIEPPAPDGAGHHHSSANSR